MTKYIDRYYLNWELYGIKFAETGWQPGANTLAYYPLNWDTNDYSLGGKNLTSSGNVSFVNIGIGKQVAYMQWNSSWNSTKLYSSSFSSETLPLTLSIWEKLNATTGSFPNKLHLLQLTSASPYSRISIWNAIYDNLNRNWKLFAPDDIKYITNEPTDYWDGNWHHLVATFTTTQSCLYKDWQLVYTWNWWTNSTKNLTIYIGSNDDDNYWINGYVGDAIIERWTRSLQDVQDYYNLTKSLYGIS